MAEFVLKTIMDGIANTLLAANVTKRAYAYPVPSPSVPCVIVGYPELIDFDFTFKRGADRAEFPVWFVVGKVDDKSARDNLSAILTGAGGIKDVLDGTLGGTVQSTRCVDAKVETITIADTPYLVCNFKVEVIS